MKEKIIIPVVIAAFLGVGGIAVLTRSDDKVVEQPAAQKVETKEVESIEEIAEIAEVEAPIVEQAPVARTAPEEEVMPVDTRPEWRKFFDGNLATDPDAPYIISCIEHNTSVYMTGVDSRFWAYGDEYRNGFVEAAYNRVKGKISISGLTPQAFAEAIC